MIIVTPEAYNKLCDRTKAQLLLAVFGPSQTNNSPDNVLGSEHGFTREDWVDVVKLTPGQAEELIDEATSLYEGTRLALKLFAEHGPIMHSTSLKTMCVDEDGEPYWEELSKFQASTTRRARAVMGDKHAMLLAWPDWNDGEGYYGITKETHRALRIYFELD